jgi:hypothetical protein
LKSTGVLSSLSCGGDRRSHAKHLASDQQVFRKKLLSTLRFAS